LRGEAAVWPKEGEIVRRHKKSGRIRSFMGERDSFRDV